MAVKVKENLMYIGPTIAGALRQSTVYAEGKFPSKAYELMKEYPPMKKLFVTLEQAPEALAQLEQKSSLSTIYTQVSKLYGGK